MKLIWLVKLFALVRPRPLIALLWQGFIVFSILSPIIFVFLAENLVQQNNLVSTSELLPVSISARETADYTLGAAVSPVPVIDLDIIADTLKDMDPESEDIDERISLVETALALPVPTGTIPPSIGDTPAAASTLTASPSPTERPAPEPGQSPTLVPTQPTPSQTPTLSSTPTRTSTRVTPSETKDPPATATLEPNPSATATLSATPTYTAAPKPSATVTVSPLPTAQGTGTPTPVFFTPTLLPSSTPTYLTATPTQLPAFSATPTLTPAAAHTPTWTPRPSATLTLTLAPTPPSSPTPTETAGPLPTATLTPTQGAGQRPTHTPTIGPSPTRDLEPSPTKDLTPEVTLTFTPAPTSTPACSPPLPVDGRMPDGYVLEVKPGNGEMDFPVSSDTLLIYYNQPMTFEGGSGSVRWPGSYQLTNLTNGKDVEILNRVYDLNTYTLELRISLSDRDWSAGTQYRLTIVGSIRNLCGEPQGEDINITFATAPERGR